MVTVNTSILQTLLLAKMAMSIQSPNLVSPIVVLVNMEVFLTPGEVL